MASGALTGLPGVRAWTALSPDDKTVYGVRRDPDGKTPARIVALDVTTSKEREIFESRSTAPLGIALSPDGRTFALGWVDGRTLKERKLCIARVGVDGGGYREIYTLDRRRGGSVLAWSRDGRSIFFDQQRTEGSYDWGVVRVPAEGGPAVLAFQFNSGQNMQNFDLSTDGSRFVYSANERAVELWALDNVLTALK